MNYSLWTSLCLICTTLLSACEPKQSVTDLKFASPTAGTIVRTGQPLTLKLEAVGGAMDIDSLIYWVDGTAVHQSAQLDSAVVDLGDQPLGNRSISATVYTGGEEKTVYSNVVLLPPTPKVYGYKVIHVFPHDPEAFTQGLEYHNGVLFESTGQYDGKSSLRRVALESGKVQQKINLDANYFGEGMTIVGNRIIQLTWMEGVGLVYDLNSFAKIGQFSYGSLKEGWGLCFDGNRLIASEGSNKLYFLNKDSYKEEGTIAVYNHRGPVKNLNELEYIDGKIYANVYQEDIIVVINPQTGAVEAEINLSGIYPEKDGIPYDNELNGIAYDAKNKRLFVTGKNWSKLFEIELVAR